MWGHMGVQGMNMGYGAAFGMLLWLAIIIWLIIFTILVLGKMDKIIKLLEKK
ncbi:MAG: hypothetical protein PHD29_03070 [bacterium]|nr:hypothetical protein [bacterium]MDD5353663.1 hypothetical protein [bacterium]MDD5756494.1 hypothetical protein [bacterium]